MHDRFKLMKKILSNSLLAVLYFIAAESYADIPVVEIFIKEHLFYPSDFEVPANTKVKLLIHNHDDTAEEFESYELNREKVIGAGRKAVVFIGPLAPGDYSFFGEFYPKTAQGVIRVK